MIYKASPNVFSLITMQTVHIELFCTIIYKNKMQYFF